MKTFLIKKKLKQSSLYATTKFQVYRIKKNTPILLGEFEVVNKNSLGENIEAIKFLIKEKELPNKTLIKNDINKEEITKFKFHFIW